MSEEMAVCDNATGEDASGQGGDTAAESVEQVPEAPPDQPNDAPPEHQDDTVPVEEAPPQNIKIEPPSTELEIDIQPNELDLKPEIVKSEGDDDMKDDQDEASAPMDGVKDEIQIENKAAIEKRGIKRRASDAFSDEGDVEFKGFDNVKTEVAVADYTSVLERLEAEVSAARKNFTPIRHVMATPAAPLATRPAKRPRNDTDGSRPSSAQSSRSEGDDPSVHQVTLHINLPMPNPSASPAHRGRRPTTEMSSPLLRIPLERGWKRELVYRAALDAYSRRNADIYYYTPQGKKLRSTREVSEQLSGTGLTLENFSFFKEPLGVDDPEKEIIRDAKLMRRMESPSSSPAPTPVIIEGKRTPKPKPPKGASPEPTTPKSPPAKLKVKSMGARLSNSTPAATKQQKKGPTASPAPTPAPTSATPTPAATDNNNSAAWKKPRPLPAGGPAPVPPSASAPEALHVPRLATPPPLQSRPVDPVVSPDVQPSRVLQPCSLACGAGVPSLSCGACLCMYHAACAGATPGTDSAGFLCKNCRKSTSPSSSPPPLTHKSAVGGRRATVTPSAPTTPASTPTSGAAPGVGRVLLRMKVSGGGADGEKVWAVAGVRGAGGGSGPRAPTPAAPPAPAPASPAAMKLPQSLVCINGRSEEKRRTRVTNGAVTPTTPAPVASPRRRGRTRPDDTDHFTAFYKRAQGTGRDVALQIFQYLGMRELARCASVCKLWCQLAATPALWRHVRMKNSHVSEWSGLCASLKRHGTKWLDLRKMLLPQNDTVFWEQFSQHIATVDTLERLELCRCPAKAVEAACTALPGLTSLAALAIKDGSLDPRPLARAPKLQELRIKSLAGLALTADLTPLAGLHNLRHLSLTSIKELGWRACDVVGSLPLLESLELGECTFRAEFGSVLAKLSRLRRLRLERGTALTPAADILRAIAALPALNALELVNVDVKLGFDDALAACTNIQRLLIIPTYVSQSATTNQQVLSGLLRLKDTLTHLMWGVTIELLRVTELFIDQCSAGGAAAGANARRELGECIPVLKPVPGCRLPMDHQLVAGPPQVEILPLPTLQRLLSAQLPNTKLKLLRIPFHATWRQSLADFQ